MIQQFTYVVIGLLLVCVEIKAHTALSGLVINGQARGDCVRPPDKSQLSWPVQSKNWFNGGIYGKNYTCGFTPYAEREASATCEVQAGSTIQAAWSNPWEPDTYPILIENHKGPILIYMAKWNHGQGGIPTGADWFKVGHWGLKRKMSQSDDWQKAPWAAPYTMWENQGRINMPGYGNVAYGGQPFTIPADIQSGDYLIRTEVITLQEVSPTGNGGGYAQLYVHCAQVRVVGGGNAVPGNKVALPGAYDLNHPGLNYVPWRDEVNVDYPFPGPAVYVSGSSPAPVPPPPAPQPPAPVPQPPAPVPAPAGIVDLYWTFAADLKGSCIQIHGMLDPHTWSDNYLCGLNEDISSWRWSSHNAVPGDYKCIQWFEAADWDSWGDNFLCIPNSDIRNYAFSCAGPIPGMSCISVNEPSDPDTWSDNYFCTSAPGQGNINVGVNFFYNASESHDEASRYYTMDSSSSVLSACLILTLAIIGLFM